MWFWKKHSPDKAAAFAGRPQTLTGESALFATEQLLSDSIVVHSSAAPADGIEVPSAQVTANPKTLAAMTAGYALMGQRAAAITGTLGGLREDLYHIAGRRLACVIHLVCHAVNRHTGAVHGSHDEYHDIAGAGLFQLFAGSAQEVADFSLLAHRIAELSLVPGLCAQDYYRTSHAMQPVLLPQADLVTAFAGAPGDAIASPTPAQSLLFGERRRRIPLLLDQDNPAGLGAVQDHESFFRAVAAQRPFFYGHLGSIIDTAFAEFAELTGRRYGPLTAYRSDDAEYLVIAQGAVGEELVAAVDLLRSGGVRAGLVKLNLLRPFPGAELTALLKGKRAVTVLERTEQPLAEDPPLMREVRSALDKALENGGFTAAGKPWPDYQAYRQSADRPAMFSGVYGVGADLPAVTDLAAVYRNMQAGERASRRFYVGPIFTPPDRRFPQLQTLQQTLNREYPQLAGLSVSAAADAPVPARRFPSAAIHFLSSQGGLFAANWLAAAMAEALACEVRTFPQGGLEQLWQPATVTLAWNRDGDPITGRPVSTDALLVSSYKLLENPALLSTIEQDGKLIVASNKSADRLSGDLSPRLRRLIENRALEVLVIDTERLLAASASHPAFIDQLSVWALIGAWLQSCSGLSATETDAVSEKLQRQLGDEQRIVDEVLSTMRRAAEYSIELPRETWRATERGERREIDPPWTVKQLSHADGHLFDVNRFWHSVGYLYDSGEAEHTLSDPWLATGVIPAASSAFRDISPYRLKLPQWLPENCTGCGICWAACPEAALPPVVLDPAAAIRGAVTRLERQGATFIQLRRIRDPLAKQVYKLLLRDELDRYLTLGELLRDAFAQLAEQMNLDDDKLEAIGAEFDPVVAELENLPIARTDKFFVEPHKREKNSGLLLSLVLDPVSCTACGICVEACPEAALQWAEQTPQQVEQYRLNWQLQLDLPGPSRERIAAFVADADTPGHVNRLLDRRAYHSMVAGDGVKSGNGARTAIHLLSASTEAIMQERFAAHAARLEQQVGGLEDLIQGNVSSTLSINDFDEFGRRLSRLDEAQLDGADLAGLLHEGGQHEIDPAGLRRQSSLLLELKQRLPLYADTSTGKGRARALFAVDPGAASFWSGSYPYNPYLQPWVCHLPGGDAAGLARSIARSIRRVLLSDIRLYRRAELELSGSYDPLQHEAQLDALGWDDLTPTERQLAPPVFLVCGSHQQREITALLAEPYPFKVVMIDQQGLLVPEPGREAASSELAGEYDSLHGPQTDYLILQCCVGQPGHLIKSVGEMLDYDGPSLLHVYAPDPHANGFAIEKCIGQAALAARSRVFPLFRAERRQGRLLVSIDDNPAADADWSETEMTVREHGGQESMVAKKLTVADWAVNESRYRRHFDILPRGHLNETMTPLADYLELDADGRETLQPYIDIADDAQQHRIAVVSAEMGGACELARNNWRRLQRLARPAESREEPVCEETAAETRGDVSAQPPPPAPQPSVHQQLTERLLELCGYRQDPEFFNRSLGDFLRAAERTDAENEPIETSEEVDTHAPRP